MKLLREYIRILLKEQPDLGNVVFGVDEEDTEYEKELFAFFEDHFDGRNDHPAIAMDPSLVANIKSYMADPRYKDVLRPYKGPAFRGLVMDARELIPILLTSDWDVRPGPNNIDNFLKKKNKKGFSAHDVSYSYKPEAFGNNSLFSHWSKDIGTAYGFADSGGIIFTDASRMKSFELPMRVIMYAQPGQTFLDAQGLYDLPSERNAFVGFSDEEEVIGMGDIQISRILIRKEGRW